MIGSDRTRRRILERRAAFVGASLAALSGCPSPARQEPASTEAMPVADTAPAPREIATVEDAGTPDAALSPQDATLDAAPDAGPRVILRVCLSIIRPPPITFRPGDATPSPSSAATLDQVAEAMLGHPDLVVEVQGHTDASEANAKRLSEHRARVVKQALLDRGVAAERLFVCAYGQTRPLAPNRTADERAQNRRVEFRVLQGDEACLP